MKHLLLTTIAALLVVGCGESQQSAPAPEAKPVEPVAKAPDMSIYLSIQNGLIEAVKQHIVTGTDVNAKDKNGDTPLHHAAWNGHKEIIELLIAKGADVNAKDTDNDTPLDEADGETADLLRKHGGKTGEELKAEGK